MMAGPEPRILRVSDADAVRDLAAILQRVQAGTAVVIERDAQPLAIIRATAPERRTISECISAGGTHEKESGDSPVLDPDFAADLTARPAREKKRMARETLADSTKLGWPGREETKET